MQFIWHINVWVHPNLNVKCLEDCVVRCCTTLKEITQDIMLHCEELCSDINYKITFWKCDLWLAKSCVSITVWQTWKSSHHYVPSHTPSQTVWRIYTLIKKAISTLVFYELFYKRNGKHSPPPVFPYVIETLSLQACVPTSISHSPKLPLMFLELYGNTENVLYFLSKYTFVLLHYH